VRCCLVSCWIISTLPTVNPYTIYRLQSRAGLGASSRSFLLQTSYSYPHPRTHPFAQIMSRIPSFISPSTFKLHDSLPFPLCCPCACNRSLAAVAAIVSSPSTFEAAMNLFSSASISNLLAPSLPLPTRIQNRQELSKSREHIQPTMPSPQSPHRLGLHARHP
jgi:hypothetical protein